MDFQKIFTDSLASTLRTLLFVGRRLIIIPVITKLINVGSYGVWATVIGLVLLFSKFGGIQMQGALIRYTSLEDDTSETIGGTLLFTAAGATVASVAFFVFATVSGFLENAALSGSETFLLILIATVMIFLRTTFAYVSNSPRSQNRVKEYESVLVIELFAEITAIVVTLYVTRSVVWGMGALAAVLFLANVVLAVRYLDTSMSVPEVTKLRRYVTYSAPLVIKGGSAMILSTADKFLLLYLLSPAAAGAYAVAYSICGVFRSLSSVLNPTLYPAVSGAWDDDERDQLRTLYENLIAGFTILAVPALVGITFLAPSVLRIVSTDSVSQTASLLVPIIGIGLLFRAYEGPLSYILKASERTAILGAAVVVAAAVNVVMNLALIPTLKLYGAAFATLVSEVLIFAVVFYYARSLLPFPLPSIITMKVLVASGVMAVVLWQLPFAIKSTTFLVVAPPAGAVSYFVVLFTIGGVPDGTVRRVTSYMRGLFARLLT